MELASGLGYVLGLLGLLGTLHYGRQSRETEKAFVRYVDLDEEVKRLRASSEEQSLLATELERVKGEVFRLRQASVHSPDALRLARAAESLAKAKAVQNQTTPNIKFRYIAKGDHQAAVSRLQDEFEKSTGSAGRIVDVRFYDNANTTSLFVEGAAWPEFLKRKPEWRHFENAVVKDWITAAVIAWSQKACEVSSMRRTMSYVMSAATSGESVHLDVQSISGQVCRLGVLATLDDHRPVPMAKYFEGSIQEVEAAYKHWTRTSLTPI